MPMITNTSSSQISQKLFFVIIHPMMNSPTDCNADGRGSHKNMGENKSNYSLDHSINSALQYKTSDESVGGGVGKYGKNVMMGNCLSLLELETVYLMVVVLLFLVLQQLN